MMCKFFCRKSLIPIWSRHMFLFCLTSNGFRIKFLRLNQRGPKTFQVLREQHNISIRVINRIGRGYELLPYYILLRQIIRAIYVILWLIWSTLDNLVVKLLNAVFLPLFWNVFPEVGFFKFFTLYRSEFRLIWFLFYNLLIIIRLWVSILVNLVKLCDILVKCHTL